MKKLILPILLGFIAVIAFASGSKTYTEIIPNPEGKNYIYRITLKDKAETPFSLSEPEKFLSLKSIERRSRQGLAIDSTDLPVSPAYLRQIQRHGVEVVGVSKWNNTVLVRSENRQRLEHLQRLPFVSKTLKV